jgi:nitrite reductase/ring-hydroxylating ferredoxin subunit/uncharacterized membrane protein
MAPRRVITVIGEQRWLDPVADVLQQAVARVYASGGPTSQMVKKLVSGTWLGHPLHPVLTDVPFGAWTVALACDTLEATSQRPEYAAGADAAIVLGVGGAIGSALTGLSDWHYTRGRPRRVGIAHGLLNLSATGLYVASLVARQRGSRAWGRGLAFVGYAVAAFSAYLGGDLVYGDRLGTDHAPARQVPGDFTPALAEAELREGQPHSVEVNGVPVLLVRQGERIYALGQTCAHLGGPLAEGAIGEGTVTYPWHGSRFALADGRVIHGPATFPQPCYQTRVRNGKIEVRLSFEPGYGEAPARRAQVGATSAS